MAIALILSPISLLLLPFMSWYRLITLWISYPSSEWQLPISLHSSFSSPLSKKSQFPFWCGMWHNSESALISVILRWLVSNQIMQLLKWMQRLIPKKREDAGFVHAVKNTEHTHFFAMVIFPSWNKCVMGEAHCSFRISPEKFTKLPWAARSHLLPVLTIKSKFLPKELLSQLTCPLRFHLWSPRMALFCWCSFCCSSVGEMYISECLLFLFLLTSTSESLSCQSRCHVVSFLYIYI